VIENSGIEALFAQLTEQEQESIIASVESLVALRERESKFGFVPRSTPDLQETVG
jgi:hypothetical protein